MPEIDELDSTIIELLMSDGMLTNTAIAEHLGLSESTIRRRRSQLEADGVIRVVAVADPFKIGFPIVAIIGLQIEKGWLKEAEEELKQLPQIRFLRITLGVYDMLLEAWFRSNDELLSFVTVTLAEVSGIRRTESFFVLRLPK